MTDIKLHLEENFVLVDIEKSGYIQKKTLSYEDLSKSFSSSSVFDSGILPGEYGVKYIKKYSNGKTVVYYVEPAKVIDYKFMIENNIDEDDYYDDDGDFMEDEYHDAVNNNGEDIQNLKTIAPILLWEVAMSNSDYPSVNLYAMKQAPITGLEKIYKAPFGNIYSGNQRICWGDDSIYVPSLQAIHGISFTFFNDYENFDLADYRIKRYTRKNGYEGKMPIHLHEEIDEMLSSGTSEKEALKYIHDLMLPFTPNAYEGYDYEEMRASDSEALTFKELIQITN